MHSRMRITTPASLIYYKFQPRPAIYLHPRIKLKVTFSLSSRKATWPLPLVLRVGAFLYPHHSGRVEGRPHHQHPTIGAWYHRNMNLLNILNDTPDNEHSVVIYPDRRTLREDFQPYVGKYSRLYRTNSLHRSEYLEDPQRHARVYLRTPKQITAANRNRAIDGAIRAYAAEGVKVTSLMKTRLNQSGITQVSEQE